MSVTLQPMTEAEYAVWLRDAVATYAQEFVDSHILEPDQAQERAEKDFATSDAIRDELASKGVEVMDGDPLGWEWRV